MSGWPEFIRYLVCVVFLLKLAYFPTREGESSSVVRRENKPTWQCEFLKAVQEQQ